jgi:hypothetical protein
VGGAGVGVVVRGGAGPVVRCGGFGKWQAPALA